MKSQLSVKVDNIAVLRLKAFFRYWYNAATHTILQSTRVKSGVHVITGRVYTVIHLDLVAVVGGAGGGAAFWSAAAYIAVLLVHAAGGAVGAHLLSRICNVSERVPIDKRYQNTRTDK